MSDIDVDAGTLTLQMRIEEDVSTDDTNNTTGERVSEWRPWGSGAFWCGRRQLRGREVERAMLQYAEATHLITMRYVSGIRPLRFRGWIGDTVYHFGVVDDIDGRHIKLEIMAAEKVAER